MFANKVEHQKGYFVFFSYFLLVIPPSSPFLVTPNSSPSFFDKSIPTFPIARPCHFSFFAVLWFSHPRPPPLHRPPPHSLIPHFSNSLFSLTHCLFLSPFTHVLFSHTLACITTCLLHQPGNCLLNYRFCSSLSTLSSNVIDFITSWRRLAEVIKSIAFAVSVDSDSGFVCQHDKLKKLSNVLIRKFVGLKD